MLTAISRIRTASACRCSTVCSQTPVHGDVPLGIRNTFRGDEVLLFVGLNADAPQTAHIRATESPLTVFDPQTGERVHLSVGEDLALTLHYGECELRILQTLT